MTPRPLAAVLREVSDLHRVCVALRRGFIASHPEARLSSAERERVRILAYIRQEHPEVDADIRG